mgnify:CR=1 FL=1
MLVNIEILIVRFQIIQETVALIDYLLVGSYIPPDENEKGEVIKREFYGQGMIFKSDEAFYDWQHPDRVCYIPELSDSTYTREYLTIAA